MIDGYAYIYTSQGAVSQALGTIGNINGVDFAYLVSGKWNILAVIYTQDWYATMNAIRDTPGVIAVSSYQA